MSYDPYAENIDPNTDPATVESNDVARASAVAHANPYDQVSQFFKTNEPILDQDRLNRNQNVARVNSFGTALSGLMDAVGGSRGAIIPKRELPDTSIAALNDYNQERLRYAGKKDAYDKEQLGLKYRGLQWQDEQNRANNVLGRQQAKDDVLSKQHEADNLFKANESKLNRDASSQRDELNRNANSARDEANRKNSRDIAGMHIDAAKESRDKGITPENHPNDFRTVANAATGEIKNIPKNSFNTVMAQLVADNGGSFDSDTKSQLELMKLDPIGQQGVKEQWVQQNWYKYPNTRALVYKLAGDTQSDPKQMIGSQEQYNNLLLKANKTPLEKEAIDKYNAPKVHAQTMGSVSISNTLNNPDMDNETKKRELFKSIRSTGVDKVEAKRQLDLLIQSYKL